MSSPTNSVESFLEELTSQFNRLIDIKERLDNKANQLMTMAGTICTIFLGVGIFLLKSIVTTHPLFYPMLSLFVIGMSFLIFSIVLSIISYRLRDQTYPMGSDIFFEKCCYQKNIVDEYINADETEFKKLMIQEYLYSIKDAEKTISEKGTILKWSQVIFLVGLLVIPIIIVISVSLLGKIPVLE